jgi:glutathione S-transferase
VNDVPNVHWHGDLDSGECGLFRRHRHLRVESATRVGENRMITLFDFRPSQNAWKVRQLLCHLRLPYESASVSAFEKDSRRVKQAPVDHWGPVPVVRLEDGRVLSESNTILWYLSDNTAYRPEDPFTQAKVFQWLSFEADYIQTTVGSLHFWALTGDLSARPLGLVDDKRATANRALSILDRELATQPFIAADTYSIADIAIYAYAHLAADAGLSTHEFPAFEAWIDRVRAQQGFLAPTHPLC